MTEIPPTKHRLLATILPQRRMRLQHIKHHPMKLRPTSQAINLNIQDTPQGK